MNTSRSFVNSPDEKRGSQSGTSVEISAPQSEDGDGGEGSDGGEDADEGDASGKQETSSIKAEKNAARDGKPSAGPGTDGGKDDDDDDDAPGGEMSDDADENAATNHSARKVSLIDDDTEEDNKFPDEGDESEDVDEDELPPVGMSPAMYSHVASTEHVQDFVNFQADEDDANDDDDEGSTGEFTEYSRSSGSGLSPEDLARVDFSGNKMREYSNKSETASHVDLHSRKSSKKIANVSSANKSRQHAAAKPPSKPSEKIANVSTHKDSNSRQNATTIPHSKASAKLANASSDEGRQNATTIPHSKASAKLANASSDEGRQNATTIPHTRASKHSELGRALGTGSRAHDKRKLHRNPKKTSHRDAHGHPGVKRVSKKLRGKPAITVLSHSSKKHFKGRFKVPREKFLGRGVSLIGYSSRNTTVAHRLGKRRSIRHSTWDTVGMFMPELAQKIWRKRITWYDMRSFGISRHKSLTLILPY